MSISSVITERLSVLHRLPEDISRGCALSRLRFAFGGLRAVALALSVWGLRAVALALRVPME